MSISIRFRSLRWRSGRDSRVAGRVACRGASRSVVKLDGADGRAQRTHLRAAGAVAAHHHRLLRAAGRRLH